VSELSEKVRKSIERLKLFEPEDGYYLAFSGGKDSVTCKALMDMAGVKYDATYRVTSVDPPELVRFIKDVHPDVKRGIPRYAKTYKNTKLAGKPITMWNLIPEKMMPPTRLARYCCEKLKEDGGDGRVTVTGVRWAESANRKNNQGAVVIHGDFRDSNIAGQETLFDEEEENDAYEVNERHGSLILTEDNEENRRIVENCFRRRKTVVNPIIEWTDADVWDFIHTHTIPYCSLYDEGRKRIGCIGCPMAGTETRLADFARWPKYEWHYRHAFGKMLEKRRERYKKDPAKPVWRAKQKDTPDATVEDVWLWWLEMLPEDMR
jgi:phosphoadenosine phosphosulfate reductase